MIRLPTLLYESLPYAYVLLGVLAVAGVDPVPGRLSGLVLLLAGLHVFRLRRAYRQGY